ncbi:MAG: type II toxin-antitoxin system RelE/ParE family toxin [Waddliaceae bacterium]
MGYEIEIFAKSNGKEPFVQWLETLDVNTQALVLQRLQRIKSGNFGDCKPIASGLWEFRIHSNSGLRIYYNRSGEKIILILGGGIKRTQNRDINQAKKYLEEYRSNQNEK